MNRLIALVLVFALAPTARAVPNDELKDALKLLRQRVVFVDNSPGGKMFAYGLVTTFFGGSLAAAKLWDSAVSGPTFPRQFVWFGGALVVVGLGAMVTGVAYKKRHPFKMPVPPPIAHYQTVEGLNDFMALSDDQQYEVANANEEFRDFILRLADAYRFVTDHQIVTGQY